MKCFPRLLLPFLSLLLAACSHQGPDPLVIGMELKYPPFEMTDKAGNPTGVSVDLAYALGEELGRDIEIRNISFDGLIPALKTGNIDLILSSMTRTEERARSIDFSDPYLFTGLAILAGKDKGVNGIHNLNEAGRVVAVKLGTTGHVYAKEHLPNATLRVLEDENTCVLEVAQGKADGFLYDQMSVYRNAAKHPDTTTPLVEPFKKEAWAIGIRKGNEELRKQVNQFLSDFRAKRGFDEIGDRYLKEMQDGFAELGIPFVFDPHQH